MDPITPEEKLSLDQLREKMADVPSPRSQDKDLIDDDHYLRKWLRARQFNVTQAEEMLRKHIQFMKGNGLDNLDEFIKKFEIPEAAKYFHTARLGYDKEGSIVRILNTGAADLRGMAHSVSKMDAFRVASYVIYTDILQQQKDRKGNALCDKQVYIFDLEGLNWASVINRTVVERAYTLMKNYVANHPETLKTVYIVHAPSFFSFIYNWLKTFLPESIISKIEILSQEEMEAVIMKKIDPSIVPASVGGKRIDPNGDPNCPSLYTMPLNVPVPESLMLYQQLAVLENDPTAKRVTVECGCACRVRVGVKETNSLIQWDFQTGGYDIRFGLCFKEDENSESSEIITPHRVESHMYPESGTFSCSKPGLYELVFDNTYSWLTRKDVIYKVKVVKPNEINVD